MWSLEGVVPAQMHEALGSPHKLNVLVHTYNPSTQEMKMEKLGFKVILRYVISSQLAYVEKKKRKLSVRKF